MVRSGLALGSLRAGFGLGFKLAPGSADAVYNFGCAVRPSRLRIAFGVHSVPFPLSPACAVLSSQRLSFRAPGL